MTERIRWPSVLIEAKRIVESYDTGVTLRQLFYRLVAAGLLPNTQGYYKRLSDRRAEGRREGWFPELLDRTSRIERPATWAGPDDACDWLQDIYCRDRTEGQDWTIYLGVEKAGMSAQLDAWFSDPLGIPHVALGGYASQTFCDAVRRDIEDQDRPAVLIYAGDLDPSGEDIDRDFVARVGAFEKVVRIALNEPQVIEFGLIHNPNPEVAEKLERDSRGAAFKRRHPDLGLVQFEVDALPPETLRDLYRDELDAYWDMSSFEASRQQENTDIAWLRALREDR